MASFSSQGASTPSDGTTSILSAAGTCKKLQRLSVNYPYENSMEPHLGLRHIPGELAALGSLTGLDLRRCGLQGAQQLPLSLVDLRLEDSTTYTLPASLASLTSLTSLTVSSTATPPPAWPTRLHVLQVPCL